MEHLDRHPRPSPFSHCLLQCNGEAGDRDHCHSYSLLPASYLTETDDVAAPRLDSFDAAIDDDFDRDLDRELDLTRLTKIRRWLWLVGRPNPTRPLHRQIAIGREIVIDERMDMHLVWNTGCIFIKPLPRFLLCSAFWSRYLSWSPHSAASSGDEQQPVCRRASIRQRALGLLFSYVTLIRYESDFLIAREKHLLPKEVTWPTWSAMVREFLTIDVYDHIDERFIYGELRLSRLNKIYRLSPGFTGYVRAWQRYDEFWNQTFAILASLTVYIAIVLTAMQVGLATTTLRDNYAFNWAAYVFTVFAILAPLIFSGLALVFFCYLFVNNWNSTKAYKNKRMRYIHPKAKV